MPYTILALPKGQWTGLTNPDDNKVPLKWQNLTSGIVKVIEAENIEAAKLLNTGFIIPERGIFETTGTQLVFFNALTGGNIIYMVDTRA